MNSKYYREKFEGTNSRQVRKCQKEFPFLIDYKNKTNHLISSNNRPSATAKKAVNKSMQVSHYMSAWSAQDICAEGKQLLIAGC